jgi:hypothetical protein
MSDPLSLPRHPDLRIADMPNKGRGVVTAAAIAEGTVLEVAPVIPLLPKDQPGRGSVVFDYPFYWDDAPYVEAIALGMLSMVNHSKEPNAWFEPDIPNKVIRVAALRDIAAGEEITFDYGIPLWFNER